MTSTQINHNELWGFQRRTPNLKVLENAKDCEGHNRYIVGALDGYVKIFPLYSSPNQKKDLIKRNHKKSWFKG